jgi:hypothetical protein
LISKSQFERVQDILHGRVGRRTETNDFLFRRFVKCAVCGYSLIGEHQKGHVYYRCHGKTCRRTIIREEAVAAFVEGNLRKITFSDAEIAALRSRLAELKESWIRDKEREVQAIAVRIEQVTERLNRVTDAYLDQALDKAMFEERKTALLQERRTLEDAKRDWQENRCSVPDAVSRSVELAGRAYFLYKSASTEKRRLLLRTLVSNCAIREKSLDFTWHMPFQEIAAREKSDDGAPSKEIPLTDKLLGSLTRVLTECPDSLPTGFQEKF